MSLRYPIKLSRDDNGTFLVTSPAFPEVTTFGEGEEDALRHARDALEEAIAARIAAKQEIPVPPARIAARCHKVELPWQTELKIMLYQRLRKAKLTRADLMRRLSCPREQVDRLFRLDHASRLDQLEAAFRALGTTDGLLDDILHADEPVEVPIATLSAEDLGKAQIRGVTLGKVRVHEEWVVFDVGEGASLTLHRDRKGKLTKAIPHGVRAFRQGDEIFLKP